MNRRGARFGHLRLVLVAAIAVPVVISLSASPTNAALNGLTNFEIDSDTIVTDASGTDWTSKFDAGQVTVSNDSNFTGSPVVQPDVGSSDSAPDWLPNCPNSNFDSVFTGGTKIDDPTWVGDIETQSVSDKDDICQSYFSNDVVPSGPRAGDIVAYIGLHPSGVQGRRQLPLHPVEGSRPRHPCRRRHRDRSRVRQQWFVAGPQGRDVERSRPHARRVRRHRHRQLERRVVVPRVFRRSRDRPHRARSRPERG